MTTKPTGSAPAAPTTADSVLVRGSEWKRDGNSWSRPHSDGFSGRVWAKGEEPWMLDAIAALRASLADARRQIHDLRMDQRAFVMCIGCDPDAVADGEALEAANGIWREMKALSDQLADARRDTERLTAELDAVRSILLRHGLGWLAFDVAAAARAAVPGDTEK